MKHLLLVSDALVACTLLAAIALPIGCKPPRGATLQNTGDTVTSPAESPTVVIRRNGRFVCSGTLVEGGTRTITAAHCFDSYRLDRFAGWTLANGVPVSQAPALHPDYATTKATGGAWTAVDVAVLSHARIDRPAARVSFDRLEDGSEVLVSGFGLSSHDFDDDGVSNPRDACPGTRPEDRERVVRQSTNPRQGCAPEDSLGDVVPPEGGGIGVLRQGSNAVSVHTTPEGAKMYVFNGPSLGGGFTVTAEGDSGGSLFRKSDGALVGVLSSAMASWQGSASGTLSVSVPFFVPTVREFLESAL